MDELKEAVAIESADKSLRRDQISVDDGARLLEACGSLVTRGREDDTVTFAHSTVQQYLQSELSEDTGIHLDKSKSELEIAECVMAYLCLKDFDCEVVPYSKPQRLDGMAVNTAVTYRLPMGDLLKRTQEMLWKRERSISELSLPQMDLSQYTTGPTMSQLRGKYQHIDYIAQN